MFRVNDVPEIRGNRIRRWLSTEPAVSMIMAAVNFEWTVSRAIIILSPKPNMYLRSKLLEVHGLKKYNELWKAEVSRPSNMKNLTGVVTSWNSVKKAFEMRHKIVHGRDGCTANMATSHVEALLKATAEIRDYCSSCGGNIHKKLPIRKKAVSV